MITEGLSAAYRQCFFDGSFGDVVFADLIDRTGFHEDLFVSGDRPAPGVDNAYLAGRRSIMTEILNIMGITDPKRIAKALSTVQPELAATQETAETEDLGD